MKKLIPLLVLISFAWLAEAQSQKPPVTRKTMQTPPQLPAKKVPPVIRRNFSETYPDAMVNGWYLQSPTEYKVIFRDPPTLQQVIVYDTAGKVMRKETELDNKEPGDSLIPRR